MTAPTDQDAHAVLDHQQPRRRRRRRAVVTVAAIVVIAAAATAAAATTSLNPFAGRHRSAQSSSDTETSEGTSLASVTRRDLASQTQVSATLGYAGNYTVVYQSSSSGSSGSGGSGTSAGSTGSGSSQTFTELPAVGEVVSQGEVLYRVNSNPVVLLYGTTPAYRSLSEGRSASDVTGPDVAELNADLVTLGYATHAQIPAGSDEFSWQTKQALEKLQHHLGLDETGTLPLGQAVFLPSAARVTTVAVTLGAPAQNGSAIVQATSTSRQVSIALSVSQQTYVKVGDKVITTLPDNQTTPGVVSSVGTVASSSSDSGSGSSSSSGSSSNPTVTVLVRPDDPAATGTWDQSPVTVTITTATVSDALVVPITALLAQAGGGYVVEVAAADGTHRLVDVTLGVFDDADGLVQVTGTGLAAGQQVVVPTL